MGVEQVNGANQPVKTSGVSVSGENGHKLSKPEAQLANLLANLDGNRTLSRSDLAKLKKMPVNEQIKFINNALKGSGYQVANVYDGESGKTTKGVHWTSNGLFINFSKGGKTINVDQMGYTSGQSGHLGITYKK